MSDEIDWSKAPEGATHCSMRCMEFYRPAKNKKGGEFYSVERGAWAMLCDDFDYLVRLQHVIARPAWNGTGLPPVGIDCEYCIISDKYTPVRIVGQDNGNAVFRVHGGISSGLYGSATGEKFRPIRTPEQIAAEEREKAILEMVKDSGSPAACLHPMPAIFGRLYDAGYRKTEVGK